MYDGKVFIELEAQAIQEGLFMDLDIVTATPGYAAAKCTVSSKGGERIVRAASAESVERAAEDACVMALCAYYKKPLPREICKPDGHSQPKSLATAPPVGKNEGEETQSDKVDAAQDHANTQKPSGGPAAANTANQDKKGADAAQAGSKEHAAAHQAQAGAAGNAQGISDDFRVMVGNYEKREDNYISQMLGDPKGRVFLKKITEITLPAPKIKPYIDKTKSYLTSHGIEL